MSLDSAALTGADWSLIVLIGASMLFGLFRGLFREGFSLLIWAASLLIAYSFGDLVAPAMTSFVPNPTFAFPAAVLVIFVLGLVVGSLLMRLGTALIENTGLSPLDRLLGLVFGALRGGVIAVVVLVMLRPVVGETPWWRESRLIGVVLSFEETVMGGIRGLISKAHEPKAAI